MKKGKGMCRFLKPISIEWEKSTRKMQKPHVNRLIVSVSKSILQSAG